MRDLWWGYIHIDGTLHLTKSFCHEEIESAKKSKYIKQLFGPWECNSKEDAEKKIREEIGAK